MTDRIEAQIRDAISAIGARRPITSEEEQLVPRVLDACEHHIAERTSRTAQILADAILTARSTDPDSAILSACAAIGHATRCAVTILRDMPLLGGHLANVTSDLQRHDARSQKVRS
jgi:hypothetical protein